MDLDHSQISKFSINLGVSVEMSGTESVESYCFISYLSFEFGGFILSITNSGFSGSNSSSKSSKISFKLGVLTFIALVQLIKDSIRFLISSNIRSFSSILGSK
jgi:hypothetical protein